jgi:RNA polymerase sigma factor (TIGR02999 family)
MFEALRALAAARLRSESPGHTLQPTALVNEAYLRLSPQDRAACGGREHFLALASQAMRRILVDHARTKNRLKRSGGAARVPLDEVEIIVDGVGIDLEALDTALTALATLSPRQARVVELRFFGGLEVEEVAKLLDVSEGTVKGDWRLARAWLRDQVGNQTSEGAR